jgi:hypothetical protein
MPKKSKGGKKEDGGAAEVSVHHVCALISPDCVCGRPVCVLT